MREVKHKCLPYEVGREVYDKWLLVPVVFVLFVLPLGMILIGLVTMYANRIDDIPPKYQIFLTAMALAYPMYLAIKRVWKIKVLNK